MVHVAQKAMYFICSYSMLFYSILFIYFIIFILDIS